MQWTDSLQGLKGIGEKTAEHFAKLHIHTLWDLLFYFPNDYQTFPSISSIGTCQEEGEYAFSAVIVGSPSLLRINGKSILRFSIRDGADSIQVTFFNMPYLKKTLKSGRRYVFLGRIRRKGSSLHMDQPRMFQPSDYENLIGTYQPVYGLTAGISNQTIMKAIKQTLMLELPDEFLPDELKEKRGLMDLKRSLFQIHFPDDFEMLMKARQRLVYDEFFLFLILLRNLKKQEEVLENTHTMIETAECKRFLEQIPFSLTKAQMRVWEECKEDLLGRRIMNRLIQGDVGSGKTILAILALLLSISNGYQGVMMAPTEVLAVQHYKTIEEYTKHYHLPFRPVLLTGSMTAKCKREIYEQIASGSANLVIGTHAVIQDKVQFQNLGLAVTDEQHRFGVKQRENLGKKGQMPHRMVMSATPIPRTLAMIVYGDLNVSQVDELPKGRVPIKNAVITEKERDKAFRFLVKEIQMGRQVYCICPMIEDNEENRLSSVVAYGQLLREKMPENYRIDILHGKMTPSQKNAIMDRFQKHEIDILVSTTVIEVGINVPNASVMLIENAERFGLAQLHQLRGRVGRGEWQSYCIFLNGSDSQESMKRLQVLSESNDGFEIARKDLELRGPGDFFGIRQSGSLHFRLADVFQDAELLVQCSGDVDQILAAWEVDNTQYPALKQMLALRNQVDFHTL